MALFQHRTKDTTNHMDALPKFRIAGLICIILLAGMLVSASLPPSRVFQSATSATQIATASPPTIAAAPPGASPSAAPTGASATPTPQPATVRRTVTPAPLPPPGEIGSTYGIVTWGVIMVAIVLAVLLWHRPDWARKRNGRG